MRDAVQTSQNLAINTLKKHRDRIFTEREGLTLRYGDIEAASNRVANGILACGYGPGDHIAVVLPTAPITPSRISGSTSPGRRLCR